MAFRVSIQPAAAADLDEAARYIATQGNPERAREWREGALDAIDNLAESPKRGIVVPEAVRLRRSYLQIHYQAHRIVYFVDEDAQVVVVARLYHGARKPLRDGDLR